MQAVQSEISEQRNLSAYLLLLFMGIIWGFALSLAKIAGQLGGHPIGLAFWQVSVSGGLLLAISLLTGGPPKLRPDVFRFSMICGVCGVAFPAIALFWCALHLPAGVVAIAFASMPLFTYVLTVVFGVERGERRRLLGVTIGLGAMALIVFPGSALPEPGLTPWVMLALAASVGMSIENFYAGGYRPPGLSSVALSAVRQLGAVVVLLPVVWSTGTFLPVLQPWGVLQWVATANGVISGVAFTILLYVIRTSGPIFASQTAYVITLAGVGWGIILFNEFHSAYVWGALLLTMFGTALVRPRLPKPAAGVTV